MGIWTRFRRVRTQEALGKPGINSAARPKEPTEDGLGELPPTSGPQRSAAHPRVHGEALAAAQTSPPSEPVVPAADATRVELDPTDLDDALAAYRGGTYNHGYMNCGKGSAVIYAVAGTSYYQVALERVANAPRTWRHGYDKHIPGVLKASGAEAVRVLIDGMMVGHIPKAALPDVRPLVDFLAVSNQLLVGRAMIVGGGPGRNYGVRLQVRPEAATRWAVGRKPADLT